MIKNLKKKIKNIFNFFGYEINSYYPEIIQKNFDELYKEILDKKEITIFDVGANQGQSIERFKKIFKQKIIHSFEPIKFEFDNIYRKYKNEDNLIINNFALGERIEEKFFHVNHYTGSSSFLETNQKTEWAKLRSKQFKIDLANFVKEKSVVQIKTLDDYCEKNQINKIDILKIDTQGYEENVLKGSSKMILSKKIKFIEIELIFSDIYNKTLSIKDIESIIGDNYRLFANDNVGNLHSNMIYQLNLIYIEKKFYSDLKKLKL